ncbi:hypothetical protein [Geobacter sp.]|uniref:hypothetical protein n=1 Tax=Geobacter sp. TaxID=46610 RepID=UPI0027BA6BE3|nr:hypothetical protein [Geobacter sp.]
MLTDTIKKSILNIISQNPLSVLAIGIITLGVITGKGLEVTAIVAVFQTLFRQSNCQQ